jgi:hypothetical protein
MPLNLLFQFQRTKPSASENETDPSIEGAFRRYASSTVPVILQASIQVPAVPEIVSHLALVRTIEVQQVNGNLCVRSRNAHEAYDYPRL